MKTCNLFFAIFSVFFFSVAITACKKDSTNKIPVVDLVSTRSVEIKNQTGLDSVHLSGSATDADGTVESYVWSQVSGPNSSVVQNPGSPSTPVTGLIAGTYVFQLSATDNKGATGTKSITITVTISAPQNFTLTLAPANNPDETKLAGNSLHDFTSPHFSEMAAATWTINSEQLSLRELFKFDMSAIPVGATIVSAKLSLFSNPNPLDGNLVDANFGTSNAMYLRRVSTAWDISAAWNTQPSTEVDNQIEIPQTNQPQLDLIDIDVTPLVTKMYTVANYGFMFQLQNEVLYNSRIFCSSYHADASKHPKLVINYSK